MNPKFVVASVFGLLALASCTPDERPTIAPGAYWIDRQVLQAERWTLKDIASFIRGTNYTADLVTNNE